MKTLKFIFYLLGLVFLAYSGITALDKAPGMGGVYIDKLRKQDLSIPPRIIPGSITVVRIGRCYSLSTIDSTSHEDQSIMAGETRYLPYIIQNQGNIQDSILFEAKGDYGPAGPIIAFTGTDSQTISIPDRSGLLRHWIRLESGEIGTLMVKLEVPYATVYSASDSFNFKIDIKNQSGTGGGPDSTDNWPSGRTVFRVGALFTTEGYLTDRTALTKSQDWMVDQFQVKVTGALNPLAQVFANPALVQATLFSAQRKQFPVTISYPANFDDPLTYYIKQDGRSNLVFRLQDDEGMELTRQTFYQLGRVTINVAADSGLGSISTGSGVLLCSHPQWGERELSRFDLTIEPAELASVDRTKAQMLAAGPNPFSKQYQLRYYLPEKEQVSIIIYSIASEEIKVLEQGAKGKGLHHVLWDGTAQNGQRVRNGIWFCEVRMGRKRVVTRVMLFR